MKITHKKLNFLISKVVQEQFFYEKNHKKQIIQENIFKNIMSKFGKKSDNKAKAGNEKEKSEFDGMGLGQIFNAIKNAKNYSNLFSAQNELLKKLKEKDDISHYTASEILKAIFLNENLKSFNDSDASKLIDQVFYFTKFIEHEMDDQGFSKMKCIAAIANRIPNMSSKALDNLMNRFYEYSGAGGDREFYQTLRILINKQKNIDYDYFYKRIGEKGIKGIFEYDPSFRSNFENILKNSSGSLGKGGINKILALANPKKYQTAEYSSGPRTDRDIAWIERHSRSHMPGHNLSDREIESRRQYIKDNQD